MTTDLPLIEDCQEMASDLAVQPAADRPGCGQLRTAGGERLPLKALTVDTQIVALTATSTVTQRFVNTGETTLEATYVFPLPARAAVTDFMATLGSRRVVGVLKERGEARANYEEAIADGRRAAIVEEDRSDVFSVRVGNLRPGEDATVQLVLTGPLAVDRREATFRFPLVVAPRYTAGAPLPGDQTGPGEAPDTDLVPDASRITPPRLAADDLRPELAVTVSVDGAGLAVSDLRASLHSTIVDAGPDHPTLVRLRPGERADRDFLLRFCLDDGELGSSAVLVPDPEGEEGTWSVTLIPPAETAATGRDVVIVLDRSGSMDGWKMVSARRAAGRMVDMLGANDRFCVLAFDTVVETNPGAPFALVDASDRNRFAASSWLGSIWARGGTEMEAPLATALRLLAATPADRQATVVLVTDGQVTGEDHVLHALGALVHRTQVHCVGVDQAVNAGFLDRLSRLGRGRCELVESEARLDEVMARLARIVGSPALTDIGVTANDLTLLADTISPRGACDAFAGVPCVLSGRYHSAGPHPVVVVAGFGANGRFTARLAPTTTTVAAVRTGWARAVLRDLEDDYAAGNASSSNGLPARIVAHSIRFGVLSRFTAFVAIDPERNAYGPLDEVVQPVEYPSGWRGTLVGLSPHAAMARREAMAAPSLPNLGGRPRGMTTAAPARSAQPAMASSPAPPQPSPQISDLLELLERLEGQLASEHWVLVAAILPELEAARDGVTQPALRVALDRLCASLAAVEVEGGTRAPTKEALAALRQAVEASRGVLLAEVSVPPRRSGRRFWE